MTILSPALAVAMCVMFVLTRLHRHFYIFEKPFLFGLYYCLEPDRDQIAALVKATAPAKNTQTVQGKGKGKPPLKSAGSSSKPKVSVSSLAVRRTWLKEPFFTSETEFPHHQALDQLMALCCGYVAAYLFEDTLLCFYPDLLANRRSIYVGLLGVGFATAETLRISVALLSKRIVMALAGVAGVIALLLISAGDFTDFAKFDTAFSGLRVGVEELLRERLNLTDDVASTYAHIMTISARFITASVAALIAASFAAPARRFSRLDYDIHRHYRRGTAAQEEDPYSLEKPKPWTVLLIALDYVVPLLTVFLWCTSSRDVDFGSWRIYMLLACVIIRFACLRIRLQRYLDGAVDAYRKFWTEKSSVGVAEAGRNVAMQVIGTSYYLIMITTAHVAPALVSLLLTLVAKLDGCVASGLCPVKSVHVPSGLQIFAREVAGFLAWWSIAAYVLFGVISLLVEGAVDVLHPGARDPSGRLPVPTSASEKRREKRLLQERLKQDRIVPRAATS